MRYLSRSVQQTEELGRLLAQRTVSPAFIALYGGLGVGKTAFVRGFIRHFIKDAVVTSPTYTIYNHYPCGEINLYHFDMYRISDDDDLYSVGYYDLLDRGILLSEWSENIPYAIPDRFIKVSIARDERDDTVRMIDITEEQPC